MASRRMFSNAIINSARFLRMPISCQALYFHLGMRADDDGIVEAFPVIRCTGCTEDDLRVLVSKGFCTVLNEDLVTYITDWTENNRIRQDRKVDSRYKDLLIQLLPVKCQASDGQVTDICRTSAGQMTGKCQTNDRIGKDRLVKDSIDQYRRGGERFAPPTPEDVRSYADDTGIRIDADHFVAYYEARGWRLSRGAAMKDWRAAARAWAQRDAKNRHHYETERTGDLDAIVEALT